MFHMPTAARLAPEVRAPVSFPLSVLAACPLKAAGRLPSQKTPARGTSNPVGREDIEDVVFTSNTTMLGWPRVLIGCEAGQRHVVDEMRFG
jgi:hypothetical protein